MGAWNWMDPLIISSHRNQTKRRHLLLSILYLLIIPSTRKVLNHQPPRKRYFFHCSIYLYTLSVFSPRNVKYNQLICFVCNAVLQSLLNGGTVQKAPKHFVMHVDWHTTRKTKSLRLNERRRNRFYCNKIC